MQIDKPDRHAGERVRELRKEEGYTAKQFAERIGVRQSTISSWEIGRTPVSAAMAKAISAEYGVSEKWILTGQGEKKDVTTITRKRLISWINNMDAADVIALSRILKTYVEK
uniref:helix-turn-helix domain-containing protein n=1 Tax=Coprococcus catus TaxID=116085 RepID=UPI0022E32DBF|nr:helix-turn-helix transcriptional regulator [Coprococcus catus]